MAMTKAERAAARSRKYADAKAKKTYRCISCWRSSTERLGVCRSTDAAVVCPYYGERKE